MLKKPIRTSDVESGDERLDERAPADSLDRLAAFTKRIIAVPKRELEQKQPTKKPHR